MMFGMDFGTIFWIFVVGLIIWGIMTVVNSNRGQNDSGMYKSTNDALEILKRRYAKGEISKVEFERMKKDLQN